MKLGLPRYITWRWRWRERERRYITFLCPHAVKYLIYEQENGMSQCDSIHYLMAHATRGIFLIRKEHSP